MDKGANINARNEYNSTVLMLVAIVGDLEIVKYLVEHGAVEDVTNFLKRAAYEGRLSEVKNLIEQGVDVDTIVDDKSMTALSIASKENHTQVVEYLKKHSTISSNESSSSDRYSSRAQKINVVLYRV